MRAQAPDSPYAGRLAKAVFLSDRVPEALAELAATASPAAREALLAAAARAKQPEPALATPAGPPNPRVMSNLGRRRPLAQGMVALVATPEARAESVAASGALLPAAPSPVEDAQGIGIELGLAELAEGYLKAHRESALTPYLYTYLMVQYRLAFEAQATAKALEGQKASAKKYRDLPPQGPGVDRPAGQGGRRRHRRPALPPARSPRASQELRPRRLLPRQMSPERAPGRPEKCAIFCGMTGLPPRAARARMGLVALALFVVPAVAPAQTNRVEKTIPYRLDVSTKVDAKVGPVMIDNVKITNMGRGFGRGGFGPKGMQPSEGSTTLRFAFDVNNPGEDWEVTFTLELYDKAGKLIDRVTKKQNWEEKAEVWHFDHPILEYVLPMVSDVKISMSGRLD